MIFKRKFNEKKITAANAAYVLLLFFSCVCKIIIKKKEIN